MVDSDNNFVVQQLDEEADAGAWRDGPRFPTGPKAERHILRDAGRPGTYRVVRVLSNTITVSE